MDLGFRDAHIGFWAWGLEILVSCRVYSLIKGDRAFWDSHDVSRLEGKFLSEDDTGAAMGH